MRTLVSLLLIFIFISGFLAIVFYYFPQVWGEYLLPYHYREDFKAAWEAQKDRGCDMDRHLPVAVGFVESGLNPRAISRVGARGIMQLIPGTGTALAKKYDIELKSLDDLYDPRINITLGSYYLCDLLNASNQDVAQMAARYNYGPRAAGASRDALPRETQSFIRKVLSTLEAYNAIYGPNDEGPIKPFAAKQPASFLASISLKNLFNLLVGE